MNLCHSLLIATVLFPQNVQHQPTHQEPQNELPQTTYDPTLGYLNRAPMVSHINGVRPLCEDLEKGLFQKSQYLQFYLYPNFRFELCELKVLSIIP